MPYKLSKNNNTLISKGIYPCCLPAECDDEKDALTDDKGEGGGRSLVDEDEEV